VLKAEHERMLAHVATSSNELRQELLRKFTAKDEELRKEFVNLRSEKHDETRAAANKLLRLKEERESRQMDIEQRLLDVQNQLAEMREVLRAAGLPVPAVRLSNGSANAL
jgi:hypothetical protein